MGRLLSVLLNSYNIALVKCLIGNINESLAPNFSKSDIKFVSNEFNYIPICYIESDVSFIEKKDQLTAFTMRFDEGEAEVTGFSAYYASKIIMMDFSFSPAFR